MPSMAPEALEFDSDSDAGSDCSVTQTQLGVSDGPLESQDEGNPLVSRMGGRAAWLPSKAIPPVTVSTCSHCSQQMELLVQIFAPLDQSPYDRLLLVWGCARSPCQRKRGGSIRAVRVLSFNARWAAKIERRNKRQAAKEQRMREAREAKTAREQEEEAKRKTNPFSAGAKVGAPGGALFGGDTNVFAVTDATEAGSARTDTEVVGLETEGGDESEDDDDMAEELAIKASLDAAPRPMHDWSNEAPAYLPAEYLTTYSEPSSSARAYEESKESKKQLKKLKESGGVSEMKGWEAEKYESMMASGVDETFERFLKRVGPNGKQVVRYEFGGTPLAFHAAGPAYDKLWPKQKPSSTTISGAAFKSTAGRDAGREYSSDGVSPCPLCGSRRVFEVQLMPNLVNTLRPGSIVGGQQDNEQEEKEEDAETRKKREIEEALGMKLPDQPDADGITRSKPAAQGDAAQLARRTGLMWSTAFVFVCEKDCRGEEEGEVWSEEAVEVQLEHES